MKFNLIECKKLRKIIDRYSLVLMCFFWNCFHNIMAYYHRDIRSRQSFRHLDPITVVQLSCLLVPVQVNIRLVHHRFASLLFPHTLSPNIRIIQLFLCHQVVLVNQGGQGPVFVVGGGLGDPGVGLGSDWGVWGGDWGVGVGLSGAGSEGVTVGDGGGCGVDGSVRVVVGFNIGEFAGEELLLGEVGAYDKIKLLTEMLKLHSFQIHLVLVPVQGPFYLAHNQLLNPDKDLLNRFDPLIIPMVKYGIDLLVQILLSQLIGEVPLLVTEVELFDDVEGQFFEVLKLEGGFGVRMAD